MATEPRELRMVLVGRTGAGKSATGNTILGKREFNSRASSNSITSESKERSCVRNGQKIVVVDTPGLFDPVISNTKIAQEIAKCVVMAAPGPHAICLVIQASRFTPEEARAIEDIQTLFGAEASKHTLVLFTRTDDLEADGVTLDEYIKDGDSRLKELIGGCGKRYLAFNNRAEKEQEERQVRAMITMVQGMIDANGGSYYTNGRFQKAEEEIRRREEEIRKERERSGQTGKELPPPREEAKKSVLGRVLQALKRSVEELLSLDGIASALNDIFN